MHPIATPHRFFLATTAALVAAFALAAAPAAAARITGSGTPKTEKREVSGFNRVGLGVPGRIEITQGAGESLTITADDNLLPEMESRVAGGELRIRWKDGVDHRPRAAIRIALTVKSLEGIAVAGSGDVSVPALETPRLRIDIAGSGDVKLAGRSPSLEVHIAGSGDVDAAKFDAERARIVIAGSGDARVAARASLDVKVMGSGEVVYFGDPAISKTIAGSGSVRRGGGKSS